MDGAKHDLVWKLAFIFGAFVLFFIVFRIPCVLGIMRMVGCRCLQGGACTCILSVWSFFFFDLAGVMGMYWAEHTIEGPGRSNCTVLVGT
jgi:hypothetical protein